MRGCVTLSLFYQMYVFLKREDTDSQLKISGISLQEVQAAKILGVNISADLKWSTHVSQMLKKAKWKTVHIC